MRFVIGSGNGRKTFDRPASFDGKRQREERRSLANQIKGKFPFLGGFKASQVRGSALVGA